MDSIDRIMRATPMPTNLPTANGQSSRRALVHASLATAAGRKSRHLSGTFSLTGDTMEGIIQCLVFLKAFSVSCFLAILFLYYIMIWHCWKRENEINQKKSNLNASRSYEIQHIFWYCYDSRTIWHFGDISGFYVFRGAIYRSNFYRCILRSNPSGIYGSYKPRNPYNFCRLDNFSLLAWKKVVYFTHLISFFAP